MKKLWLFLALLLINCSTVDALLKVQVNRGIFSPIPIAVAGFIGSSDYADNIQDVITSDLENSGLFKTISKKAFLQDNDSLKTGVRFGDWRLIKADGLVYGSIKETDTQVQIQFRLVDDFAEKQLAAMEVQAPKSEWRKLAHTVSNMIYERLTGEKGYFTTKVAYISESGQADKRQKRLAIMDYDGENHRFLTAGRTFVMTPRFSPDGRQIAYFTIVKREGNVYIYNLYTYTNELLGRFKGMSYAPRFSADDKKILFSIAEGKHSHVFEMDLLTKNSKQLTKIPALNTSPYYSPDGQYIVFVSDRSGSPQIYQMNRSGEAGGSSAKRLTFGKGSYYTPIFSPNGQYMAFTKYLQGSFYVGVLKPDGTGERTLAQGYFVEAPTWSPNSQLVMYTRKTRINPKTKSATSKIYSIHISGFNEKEVLTPMDGTDVEWSNSL